MLLALVVPSLRTAPPRMAAATGVAIAPPPPPSIASDELALGFDFGTSGARCTVVDAAGTVVCEPSAYMWDASFERQQTAEGWVAALHSLLDSLPVEVCQRVQRIAVSGTSSSVVLCDRRDGTPATGRGLPRMYDFSVSKQAGEAGAAAAEMIGATAPDKHTVRLQHGLSIGSGGGGGDGSSSSPCKSPRLRHQLRRLLLPSC